MRPGRRAFLLFLLLVLSAAPAAETVTVKNLRQWQAPDHTRLVFDLSGPLEYRFSALQNPERVVLDLLGARLTGRLPAVDTGGPLLAAVRSGDRGEDAVRIVLDLKAAATPRAFVLKPYGDYGHRLVVDLVDARAAAEETKPAPPAPARAARELVVAIDAGHGGEDPGAIGRKYRTREKDVALGIARELARLVQASPGMRAVLIRDGDYYIGLRERIHKAQRHQADVFISIHADALPGGRVARGSSVYALSERGATSEQARVLADKENAADLIGGTVHDKDDVLMKVLVDMTQTATIGDSLALGADLLGELRAVGPLHYESVAQANFMVLKSPHIPSVLVETAFISTPEEEKKLRDQAHQRRIAAGLFDGLKRAAPRLLARRAAPTAVAAAPRAREHVVRSGETLTAIARRYDVHVEALRFLNGLSVGDPPAGQRLRIPEKKRDG
jgi:N-acetylmuramoyl-L-alanine amidase